MLLIELLDLPLKIFVREQLNHHDLEVHFEQKLCLFPQQNVVDDLDGLDSDAETHLGYFE